MTKPQRATRATLLVPARGLYAAAGLVVPTGLWLAAPAAAAALLLVEAALMVIIVLAALFGPEHVSRRAFRILGSRTTRPAGQGQVR
jgi:hypothetical protein